MYLPAELSLIIAFMTPAEIPKPHIVQEKRSLTLQAWHSHQPKQISQITSTLLIPYEFWKITMFCVSEYQSRGT